VVITFMMSAGVKIRARIAEMNVSRMANR